jgi:hypothetical protein
MTTMNNRYGFGPISTEEAARVLGLKRQGFLILKNYFGIAPVEQRRIKGTTVSNFFDPLEIQSLRKLGQRCREKGFQEIMGPLEVIGD